MFQVVRKLLPFFEFYRWSLPLAVTLGVLASLAEGIGIGLFIPFIEFIGGTDAATESADGLVGELIDIFAALEPEYRMLVLSVAIFSSIAIKAILSFANQLLVHWLHARIVHRIRSGIMGKLLSVSYRFVEKLESGRIINTLTNETHRTSEAMAELIKFMTNGITLVIYLTLLMLISWKLSLMGLAMMLCISLIAKAITSQSQTLGRAATIASSAATVREIECINGMKVIRTFGQESEELDSFDVCSRLSSRLWFRVEAIRESITPLYEILAAGFLVFTLYTTHGTAGNLSSLLVFIFILYRMLPIAKTLELSRTYLLTLDGAISEVGSLMDEVVHIPAVKSGEGTFQDLHKGLEIDQVSYRYDSGERPALNRVSLIFQPNKTTALVGPSGSGKSTLINLILGLYEPDTGSIKVDGAELNSLKLDAWRRRIAVVSQDVYLFNLSVKDNIAYGVGEAVQDEVIQAAMHAGAHEFILALPDGYDTRLGERGVRLSGGQQQRIALARAFYRNPEILILDEATNALDSISENHIQHALEALRENRTVIVIAHRLTTVMGADKIVVVDQGCIAEQGTFEELNAGGGLFSRLYQAQLRP